MACCVLAAYIIHRSIATLQHFDLLRTSLVFGHPRTNEARHATEFTVDDKEIIVQHLSLSGLTCDSCCTAIEDALQKQPGIIKITTSLLLSSATVVYQRRVVGLETVRGVIHDAGFRTTLQQDQDDADLVEILSNAKELARQQFSFRQAAALSTLAWVTRHLVALLPREWPLEWISFLFLAFSLMPAWFVQVWCARGIHLNAWWNRDKTSMDTLLSISILLGLEYSIARVTFSNDIIFSEAAYDGDNALHISSGFLVTVIIGGRFLNQVLRAKAISKISGLHQLKDAAATVVMLPSRTLRPAFLLQIGDNIWIAPDSIIPCDCYVAAGSSLVDQSLLTGESTHLAKGPGDLLLSGAHNVSAGLAAVVTQVPEKSTLARLIEAVRASSASSNTTVMVEQIPSISLLTNYFARAVMALALLASLAAGLNALLKNDFNWAIAWHQATRRAMLILSVACPCSFGLATPAATMAGLNAALRHGVLVKGGLGTMVKLATLTHIAFDKTGTLTKSSDLHISHATFCGGYDEQNICAALCTVEKEQHTKHVVGRAVFKWAYRRLSQARRDGLSTIPSKDLRVVPGKGIIGKVMQKEGQDWTEVVVGSRALLEQLGLVLTDLENLKPEQTITADLSGWSRVVHVAIDGRHCGDLVLENNTKPDAAGTITRLHQELGLEVCMLTGDSRREALLVAATVGINARAVTARALPGDKEDAVRAIQRDHGVVAMVGDGLNDLAAQAAADVSVAVCAGGDEVGLSGGGGLGPSLALTSSADVTLLAGSQLVGLCEAIRIARRTIRQARFNLIWALTYNSIALLLAAGTLESSGIQLEVASTGIVMAISSISVLLLSQSVA
ncbi:P-type Cu+ transporter [Microdochium nivale]|nr:P-type Cu+ transporter [Microdochium nivale]